MNVLEVMSIYCLCSSDRNLIEYIKEILSFKLARQEMFSLTLHESSKIGFFIGVKVSVYPKTVYTGIDRIAIIRMYFKLN